MTTVFGYPGGKRRVVKRLYAILRRCAPKATVLYSPFIGGGAFELFCAHEHKMTVYANDAFPALISFWKTLKSNRRRLIECIEELTLLSNADYQLYLTTLRRKPSKDLPMYMQGSAFYTLITSSFSGILGHYSAMKAKLRFNPKKFERVGKDTLKRIHFTNKDVSVFLKSHPNAGMSDDSVIFLDPPYALEKASTLYGLYGDKHKQFDHVKLRDELRARKNWMVCYNDCPYIRNLYKGCHIQKL